ncbi:sulfatase-like hydrolase/transferase [Alsobacter sp. R-9]
MKPANLLFILSDNHARGALGAATGGLVQTPHLDALAARGTRFSAAYTASPICCPARAALATGRYPHETGYWDNAITYDGRVPTWHHRLREAGHPCAAIGKLHFRSQDDDNGFTEEIGTMHILGGKGGVSMLLRACGEEPVNVGQWELYADRCGEGSTTYQAYDADITRKAIDWLEAHGHGAGKPWALMVSYVSAHPPFSVPRRLLDLYRDEDMPLPPRFSAGERSEHPAARHHRHIFATRSLDEAMMRRVARAYFALCTHLDEQIGQLLGALERLGLTGDTRVIYTSDHGEMRGEQGLLGKFHLYEGSAGVPLIMAGPDVPVGHVVDEPVSHVDLYPTILGSFGAPSPDPPPHAFSLWPVMAGAHRPEPVFAEYHAAGSKAGSFMLRRGRDKLIYDVGEPPQLFDLAADPDEVHDLAATPEGRDRASALERQLRTICDPEAVDGRAKADQRAKIEFWGGVDAVRSEGLLVYTPAPGTSAEIEKAP